LKYTKFDDYWDKGKPYLDGLEWYTVRDPVTAVASFEVGDAHILHMVDFRDARNLANKGYNIYGTMTGVMAIGGDTTNPESIYAKKKVREAIEYAIDKKGIAQALGHGYWDPCTSSQATYSSSSVYDKGYKGKQYNPEKAKQLLEEAGYPNGFNTRIIIREVTRKDVGIAIQGSLRKIGVKCKVDVADVASWSKHKYEGWKNALMYIIISGGDVNIVLNRHFGKGSRDYKVSLARTPGLVETLSKADKETDPKTQIELAKKAIRLMAEDAMLIPLWGKPALTAQYTSVHDFGFGESDKNHFYPGNAWISK